MGLEARHRVIDRTLGRRQPDLTVLAEKLHKPRNFSAIVRTCDAVGIREVHAIPGDDGLKVHWKTSQGAEKWVKVRAHESLKSAASWLKEQGFSLVAANMSERASDFREIDYTRPTALIVGTELFGVSEEALELADREVRIPMMGMTRSLNVSVACAIVLYEALRQREAAGMYAHSPVRIAEMAGPRFEWMHPSLAEFCRERGLEYPELDAEGNVVGELPRS